MAKRSRFQKFEIGWSKEKLDCRQVQFRFEWVPLGKTKMICQACGVEATTKYVSFHENVGLLVVRFPKSIQGHLCKSCINKFFWGMTGKTLFLGWWGMISFICTPFILLNNIGRYAFCLGMPPVEPGAVPPQLTDDSIKRIEPHVGDLFSRLNDGEDWNATAKMIADRADVTPGQVVLFVHAVIQSQQAPSNSPE